MFVELVKYFSFEPGLFIPYKWWNILIKPLIMDFNHSSGLYYLISNKTN